MNGRRAVLIAALSVLLAFQVVPLSVAAPSSTPSQPVGLALTIIPPKLPTNGTYPAVVVSLVDVNGLPSAALTNLTVFLTSSETNIASVPNFVTIPAGSEYVVVAAETTLTPGTTVITASSHGLNTAQAPLSTAIPSGYPARLEVFVSPQTLLERPDTGTVRVELVDDAGSPSKAITPVTARLVSSNISIATLNQGTLTIEPGQIYASGTFKALGNSGQAYFTASATGYGSGYAIVTVGPNCAADCGPSELLLRLVVRGTASGTGALGTLPADGNNYSALEVGLATSSGAPAVSTSDILVQLSSANPGIVSVPTLVKIPAGNISVLAPLTTSTLPGHSSITATSSNLVQGNANVTTVIPAPSELKAYVAPPSTFVSPVGNSPILVVQLQDSAGNPARARAVTDITVTSSNSSTVSGPIQLTIGKGLDDVFQLLSVSGSGSCVLTASSQGLSSSQVNLQLARSPLVEQLVPTFQATPYGSTTMWSNETASLQLSVSFLGQPIKNLTVDWTLSAGSVVPMIANSGTSGVASTTFTPDRTGFANITASASSPLTGPIVKSYRFDVIQPPVKGPESLRQNVENHWYIFVAALVVVLACVFYLLRMRRKRQRAEIEAGFEVV